MVRVPGANISDCIADCGAGPVGHVSGQVPPGLLHGYRRHCFVYYWFV